MSKLVSNIVTADGLAIFGAKRNDDLSTHIKMELKRGCIIISFIFFEI